MTSKLKTYGATTNFRDDGIIHIHYKGVHLALEDAE